MNIKHILLIATVLIGFSSTRTAHAAAQWITCTPDSSMTYKSRIHVKCTAATAGIQYFALTTSNVDHAARALSTINAAKVAGRNLWINYDPADLTGSAIGCNNSDCRLIIAVGIK